MAVMMEQHQSFKHYCRICKKGFGCGRALGGHMRAHGIGNDSGHIDHHDPPSGWWEGKFGGNPVAGTKRMYALRTNPDRTKGCRICKNCGKEFESCKSFLEHGKCGSEEFAESLVSSPGSNDDDDDGRRGCLGWSKGKRSRRVVENSNCPSSEEEELANCLVMLSTARVDDPFIVKTEESSTSADKKEEEEEEDEEEQLPNYAIQTPDEKPKGIGRGMFECKACKKVFNSHQALGGHRASHKKVKGCFAAKLEELDESTVEEEVITHVDFSITPAQPLAHYQSQLIKRKKKVHECSICHRVFASGQALGGHKRCHWVTSNSPNKPIAEIHPLQDHHGPRLQKRPKLDQTELLDLNQTAPTDEAVGVRKYKMGGHLSLEFPSAKADLYLQPWIGIHLNRKINNHVQSSVLLRVDDEADGKIKLAKLNDLKDINFAGASSPWLQMGIGSSANLCNK
ncbi:hypothetical protein AAC387_Pa06g0041 [Persea americana]